MGIVAQGPQPAIVRKSFDPAIFIQEWYNGVTNQAPDWTLYNCFKENADFTGMLYEAMQHYEAMNRATGDYVITKSWHDYAHLLSGCGKDQGMVTTIERLVHWMNQPNW